jgi:hypothetical protein
VPVVVVQLVDFQTKGSDMAVRRVTGRRSRQILRAHRARTNLVAVWEQVGMVLLGVYRRFLIASQPAMPGTYGLAMDRHGVIVSRPYCVVQTVVESAAWASDSPAAGDVPQSSWRAAGRGGQRVVVGCTWMTG